jgi:hypothetical protein
MKHQRTLQVLAVCTLCACALAAQDRPSPFGQGTNTVRAKEQSEPQADGDRTTPAATDVKPSTSGRLTQPEDPHAAELRQASALQAQWLAKHGSLNADLEDLPACSEDATRLLNEVRDAAFSSFAAFGNYYQKSAALRQQRRREAEQRGVDRMADRNEIQTLLSQSERELDDAQRRRQALGTSSAAQDRTEASDAAIRRLDAIIARTSAEMAKLRDGLSAFDEGAGYLREIRDLARDQERSASDQLALVRAESILWKAIYDSRGFREQLRCHRALPEVKPYDSPSKGGIR